MGYVNNYETKINMVTRIYLDTNVYNKIADNVPIPILPGRFGSHWSYRIYLSPLNILEILQIENDLRREVIIRILQEICAPNILAEPEALLVDFITEHMQMDSLDHLRLKSPFSVSMLSNVWKDIHSDPSKTFIFSDSIRTWIYHLKLLNHLLHAWHRSGGNLKDNSINTLGDYRGLSAEHFTSTIMQVIEILKSMKISGTKPWPINDFILILSACVLVVGVTPFPESVDKLWVALGITGIENRIHYIFDGPMRFVLSKGPLVGMAGTMASQVAKRFSPGNLLDAFHIAYLPYVSELLTLDEALLSLAKQYPKSPNFTKVHNANSFLNEIYSHLTSN